MNAILEPEDLMLPREKIFVVVDDATIAEGDVEKIIEPVWWTAKIYDGWIAYELSLKPFSRAQRLVYAVRWYVREVENGGFSQFYSNSTGIVWRDAIEGFELIGIPRGATILRISADRMGGSPSFDRQERQDELVSHNPDFDDLEDAYGDLSRKVNVDEKILELVRSVPSEFYYSGTIERIVLPHFVSKRLHSGTLLVGHQ